MRTIQKLVKRGSLRQGLSFIEFVGCLAALGGGIVLGSMYLGVDVKSMTLGVIERSELVDLSQFGWTSQQVKAEATEADATSDEQTSTTEEVGAAGIDEPNEDANQSKEDSSVQPAPAAIADDVNREYSENERLEATRAYWTALTAVMHEEAAGREMVIKDIQDWQLFDYLTHRKTGHQKAVETLESLRTAGVDELVVAHTQQILSWHLAGEQLFGRAVGLLTDGPNAELTGPFAQSWQSAATQHRMEERLLRDKHLGVAGYLDHTYKSVAPFEPAILPQQ